MNSTSCGVLRGSETKRCAAPRQMGMLIVAKLCKLKQSGQVGSKTCCFGTLAAKHAVMENDPMGCVWAFTDFHHLVNQTKIGGAAQGTNAYSTYDTK